MTTRPRTQAGLAVFAALVGLGLAGCGTSTGTPGASPSAHATTARAAHGTAETSAKDNPSSPPATPPSSPTDSAPDANVPKLVGLGLAAANDQAKAAGYSVESHDATAQGRVPALRTQWQVCFQDPAPGRPVATKTIRLAVVRLAETCPKADQGKAIPTIGPDKRLPDFTGRSLQETTNTLGSSASVLPVDVSGRDRHVLLPRDWQVCDQTPKPGTVWNGEPIRLGVVKFGEHCP